ncbi:MAG: DUF2147 domain-containing protein [Pseudomonadota bacterium]
MKRFCFLAVLMVLSSSAHAGNSFSFVVGGHRIRIEAPRHCRSPSCISVSIPGIHQARRESEHLDENDRDVADEVRAPVAMQPTLVQAAPPPGNPPAPAIAAAPPAVFKPAAAATQEVAAPPPAIASPKSLPPVPPPPPAEEPAEAVRPPPVAMPRVSSVSHQMEDEPADTPVGDWQSEGGGAVRIERCGQALCGYALKSSTKGEAVLINMKPKSGSRWTGSVYSHDSGDTYYGTMAMKGPNALRVEACALGRFYCSGNNWSRIVTRPQWLIISRQFSPEPRS